MGSNTKTGPIKRGTGTENFKTIQESSGSGPPSIKDSCRVEVVNLLVYSAYYYFDTLLIGLTKVF